MMAFTIAEKLAELEHEVRRRRFNWRGDKRHRERIALMDAIVADYREKLDRINKKLGVEDGSPSQLNGDELRTSLGHSPRPKGPSKDPVGL